MKRRNFLLLGSMLGMTHYLHAKPSSSFERSFKKVEATLRAVQEHMFPQGSKIPSAQSMHTIQFLFDTVSHETYDKDIRKFVIEGAEELQRREKGKFLSMNTQEKEEALRTYEKTRYGSNWLSRIMTLTMEGLFSDPIYGSNKKEAGWKALNAYGGVPRPRTKYIAL
ncbi:MAG TPA: gluconate 2-dehydrogenase subunit 3 family protein [Sulfurovum sp.]|nr:gluconate 2-dehydrogenase subunit 3 family protein [Sulfurovum sp.]